MSTMTEREMLELAAKAAGYEASDKLWDEFGFFKMTDDTKPNGWRPWCPLTDDGDALRLVVQLGIDLECCYG